MTADDRKPRRIAVLDVGKTNVKAVLVTDDGEAATRTMPNIVRQDGPYPHFDVPRIEAFFLDALADFQRDGGFDAVSVTAHGASGALLRGHDLALPVLDYEHAGPDDVAADYARIRPAFAETFSPRLPGGLNLGAQLFWQERRFPEAFAAATHIVTYPQYWSGWLTGVRSTEPTSLGAHTDLWAPREGRFSTLVETLGWTAKMAPLRSAFDKLGPIRAELAQRLGLTQPVPVACGIHDSNASLLPHLQAGPERFSVVSTGTWIIAFAVGGVLDRLDAKRDMLANVDAWSRPVPAARFMGGREFDLLAGPERPVPSPSAIAAVLDARIMALPGFVPGTGPFPTMSGRWSHDPERLPAEQRVVAASLYSALVTATCLDRLDAQGETIVEGPMAGNALFCDALAVLTNRKLRAAPGGTGTSSGAAALLRPAATHLPASPRPTPHAAFREVLTSYAAAWNDAADPAAFDARQSRVKPLAGRQENRG